MTHWKLWELRWKNNFSGRRLDERQAAEKTTYYREEKPAFYVDMKNLLTQWELRRKTDRSIDEKTLETNDKNEGKNR